jgi:hypothetical protein
VPRAYTSCKTELARLLATRPIAKLGAAGYDRDLSHLTSSQPMFNPSPRASVVSLGGDASCLVFDEVLLEPQRLVALAVAQREHFRFSGNNAFPGPELRMPDTFSAALEAFFAIHARRQLGGRRTLRAYSRLSLVTLQPEQLAPTQWVCHRDRMELETGRCVAACVLYLFQDPALGGTGFYRPRRSAPETARLVHDSGALEPAAFAAKYGITATYPTTSNAWFEKIASVPARFNRAIFYDGMQFHSGDILAPERLSEDPRQGRLTINGFFTCRQATR